MVKVDPTARSVVAIGPDDWRVWRALRLRALRESPEPLQLSVRRHNAAARRLYDRLGLTLVGPSPDDPDEDVLARQPDAAGR